MECGQAIIVKDLNGSWAYRFIAQCHGQFMLITNLGYRNGYVMADWHGVLRELVAFTVPAKLLDRVLTAEGVTGGQYVNLPLTYPLSVALLAQLLGADPADVRAQLEDLAVSTDT